MAKMTLENLMRGALVKWVQTAPMEEVLSLARKVEVGEDGLKLQRVTPAESIADPARRSRRRRRKKSKGLSPEALEAVRQQLLPLKVGSKSYVNVRDKISRQFGISSRQVAGTLNVLRVKSKEK